MKPSPDRRCPIRRLLLLLVVLGAFRLTACNAETETQEDRGNQTAEVTMKEARASMVARQIAARGVADTRVLEAMRTVPRHLFVPDEYRDYAYADYPLPIGEDQTISQPYIVALMTEELRLAEEEQVLEVGTGSGYQAAVLAQIVDSVFTIEIIETLADRASSLLDSLDYDNVLVKHGDGFRGWPEHAPFDAIIVTCAPDDVPQPLVDQLRDGGRMIIPVGDQNYQELVLLVKEEGTVQQESITPVRFVPMTGEAQKRKD